MTATSTTDLPLPSLVDLPAPPPKPLRFLEPGATPAQLIQATAANHTEWFQRASVRYTLTLKGSSAAWIVGEEDITIPFPRLASASSNAILDRIVADCRQNAPKHVGCWALTPTRPHDLGVRLCARGFEWGWKPQWMALDLQTLRADFPLPKGLRIAVEDEADWDVDDLPYYHRNKIRPNKTSEPCRSPQQGKRRVWHFGAWLNDKIVGHSVLHLTTGRMGVAGLYDVGVVPSARRQGVGRAVTLAACQVARALGCHYATLNAATHIYDRLGFVRLGYGQTWWMHEKVLTAPPPTPEQIAFAEAIGRGDVKTLAAWDKRALPTDLDAPLACGMTPLQLAVCVRQPRSAEWLIMQGAKLDILSAWDLGWQDRIPRLLADTPALINSRWGDWQLTPLHEAVQRNDIPLVRLLLSANPDLTLQDTAFHSTPLGWARHFERTEIVALIEQHRSQ